MNEGLLHNSVANGGMSHGNVNPLPLHRYTKRQQKRASSGYPRIKAKAGSFGQHSGLKTRTVILRQRLAGCNTSAAVTLCKEPRRVVIVAGAGLEKPASWSLAVLWWIYAATSGSATCGTAHS